MPSVDLSRLPPPSVVESLDFETLLASRKADFISRLPADSRAAVQAVLQLESEPMTQLLQESVYRELMLRQRVNEAAQATMLAFARGNDLDQILARFDLPRLVIQAANDTVTPPLPQIMESDTAYRERGQRAFDRLSVAGPRAAYVFHALSADGRVADVGATSPTPACVTVSVLARDGDGAAPSDLLAIVEAALNDVDIRPVGDRLTVQSATIVPYSIAATLHLFPGPESEPILAAARAQLQAYIAETRRIGRDVRRSAIFAALHVAGVQRVELAAPAADIVIGYHAAAYCTGSTVTLGATDE